MKRISMACCLLCTITIGRAQNTSGKIAYTETVKFNINLGGDVDVQSNGAVNSDEIRKMMPNEQHSKKVLYFSPDATLYTNDKSKEKENSDVDQSNGNMHMMIHMEVPEDITYTSIKDNKLIEQRDFMGRKFLVTSDVEKAKWKLTGQQKTILNYPCQEAVMQKNKDTITAWFTAAIPVAAGPQEYSGLPGMILEARQNSIMTIRAEAVSFGEENDKLISKPKEGKKVTEAEYKEIVEKKTKEMAQEFGGKANVNGQNVIIKIQR